jgi:NRPS condensation-like uncharacterized protein
MLAHKVIRPLDPGEAFFTLADQVSGMNFVVFAERTGALPPERVRHTLNVIQRENLLLQAGIDWVDEQGLAFVHAPESAIELRCHAVREADWQMPIEQQLSEPFALGSAPLMRCLLLNVLADSDANAFSSAPARSVLALCFHHSIGDGRSGTAILCRMLSLIASNEQLAALEAPEVETPQAMPAMLALHPPRYRWAEQPEAAKQLRTTLIGDYRRHGPLTPLPWLATQTSGRTPKFIQLRFEADVTEVLLQAARSHGSSLHGALCAAQLLAQLAVQPASKANAFCLSSPVDMRPYLEPHPGVSPTGLYVSIVSATFLIDANTKFWDLAHEIIAQTRVQIARGEGHLFFNMFGLNGATVTPEHTTPLTQKVMASPPNTMVSNVGAIATVAADPAVTAISFALCPMPYQTMFTAASTYQGQLVLNVGYDAARLTESAAKTLAGAIKNCLLSAAEKAIGFASN